jgi:flavoprotein
VVVCPIEWLTLCATSFLERVLHIVYHLKDNADATHVSIADKGESDKVCWFVLLTTAQAIVQQYFENEFNQVSCFCTMPIAREDT